MKDGLQKQIEEELHSEERSKIDFALMEEALRYGNTFIPNGMLVSGLYSSPFFFLVGLHWRSITTILGVDWETAQRETLCRMFNAPVSTEKEIVTRWELMEVNNGSNEESREELCLVQTMPQEVKGWEEVI